MSTARAPQPCQHAAPARPAPPTHEGNTYRVMVYPAPSTSAVIPMYSPYFSPLFPTVQCTRRAAPRCHTLPPFTHAHALRPAACAPRATFATMSISCPAAAPPADARVPAAASPAAAPAAPPLAPPALAPPAPLPPPAPAAPPSPCATRRMPSASPAARASGLHTAAPDSGRRASSRQRSRAAASPRLPALLPPIDPHRYNAEALAGAPPTLAGAPVDTRRTKCRHADMMGESCCRSVVSIG